jgi:hypothetical protein
MLFTTMQIVSGKERELEIFPLIVISNLRTATSRCKSILLKPFYINVKIYEYVFKGILLGTMALCYLFCVCLMRFLFLF